MPKPRKTSNPVEEQQAKIDSMKENGWKDLDTYWDQDLQVWRSTGKWKNQNREGRGSTPVHALNALDQLTPKK